MTRGVVELRINAPSQLHAFEGKAEVRFRGALWVRACFIHALGPDLGTWRGQTLSPLSLTPKAQALRPCGSATYQKISRLAYWPTAGVRCLPISRQDVQTSSRASFLASTASLSKMPIRS